MFVLKFFPEIRQPEKLGAFQYSVRLGKKKAQKKLLCLIRCFFYIYFI